MLYGVTLCQRNWFCIHQSRNDGEVNSIINYLLLVTVTDEDDTVLFKLNSKHNMQTIMQEQKIKKKNTLK